jgi:hypothetical protein
MIKTLLNMLAGAVIFSVASALAVVGQPPVPATGFGMVDGTWLNGIANGQNYSYQSGISAAGTNQATATQLPAATYMIEVDTTSSSTGVAIATCLPGTQFILYNNGANPLAVYPTVPNNPVTAAQDTINNGTSLSGNLASHASIAFACAKAGNWNAS